MEYLYCAPSRYGIYLVAHFALANMMLSVIINQYVYSISKTKHSKLKVTNGGHTHKRGTSQLNPVYS